MKKTRLTMNRRTERKSPLVSVNIRTYNSAKTLPTTLESVKKQTYPNIEIIVSDGYSKDDSVKIAKGYKARVGYADKLGDARRQNYENSKGEYILSLDSDQILEKTVVEDCVKLAKRKSLDAITIAEKSLINKGTIVEKLLAFDKIVIDRSMDDDIIFGAACPRFFRHDFLSKIEWPKELTIFDDTILYNELMKRGAKVDYLARSVIWHNEVTDWLTLIRKYFRFGRRYFASLNEIPATVAVHSLPRRSYFSWTALSKPHYFAGLLLLYCVKATAALAGALTYIITNKK